MLLVIGIIYLQYRYFLESSSHGYYYSRMKWKAIRFHHARLITRSVTFRFRRFTVRDNFQYRIYIDYRCHDRDIV